jgi:predicted membrane protein
MHVMNCMELISVAVLLSVVVVVLLQALCCYVTRFQLMLLYVTVIAPAKHFSLSLSLSLSFFFGVRSSSSLFGFVSFTLHLRIHLYFGTLLEPMSKYGDFRKKKKKKKNLKSQNLKISKSDDFGTIFPTKIPIL